MRISKATPNRPDYYAYIKSAEWRSQHPRWLKSVRYRCTLFPWLKLGDGKPYAIHHLHYRNLGNERLRRDVLPVSKFAHEWIIHGLLSGGKSAGQQRRYPNMAQKLVHEWMRLGLWLKGALVLGLFAWWLLRLAGR